MTQELSISKFTTIKNSKANKKTNSLQTKPRILVVEDNAINRKAAVGLLDILGCEVDCVTNGYDAITAYCRDYDLIFLDIGLPDLDGVSVCRQIYAKYKVLSTPIIAYTAHGAKVERECRAAGVSDFMIKPLLIDELAELLQHWIPGYEKRRNFN